MKVNTKMGLVVASGSIAFSLLAVIAYFVFTPVVVVAATFGAIAAVVAAVSGSKRTALVAAVFALVPFSQLLVETFSSVEPLVFLPLLLALAIAAWAFIDYAARRRGRVNALA